MEAREKGQEKHSGSDFTVRGQAGAATMREKKRYKEGGKIHPRWRTPKPATGAQENRQLLCQHLCVTLVSECAFRNGRKRMSPLWLKFTPSLVKSPTRTDWGTQAFPCSCWKGQMAWGFCKHDLLEHGHQRLWLSTWQVQ